MGGGRRRKPPAWVRVLQEWLSASTEHRVTSLPASFYPTRLLDLKVKTLGLDTSPLKLVSSDQHDTTSSSQYSGSYATLSYRWGCQNRLRLTKATKDSFHHRINFSELCGLFQDAVILARLLNVHYLWIDALCIVQDDPEVWAEEAALMSDIYGNAVVNIAVHTAKGDLGVFLPRLHRSDFDRRNFFSLFYRQSVKSQITDFPVKSRISDFAATVDGSSLSSRGWVFQERLLSPRVLHCVHDRLFWEDGAGCYAEDGTFTDSAGIRADWKSMVLTNDWYGMMELYSRCELTFEHDRLPAVAGLAAAFLGTMKSTYCGGIWANSVHQGVLWKSIGVSLSTALSDERGPPSWSWARSQAGVEFIKVFGHTTMMEFLGFVSRTQPTSSAYDDLSGNALLSLRAKLWQMKGMEFRGKLGSALRRENSVRVYERPQTTTPNALKYIGSLALDSTDSSPDPSRFSLVQIARTNPKYNILEGCPDCNYDMESDHYEYHTEPFAYPEIHVLVVTQSKTEGRYQRAGIGKIFAHAWPEDDKADDILIE